jgi:leucyl aminopeptidase
MSDPTFADLDAPARDLTIITAEGLPDWLAAQAGPVQAWLTGSGFEAGLGDLRLLQGSDGAVVAAVAGFGTAKTRGRLRFGLVKALAALPGGAWRLVGELSQTQREEAMFGSLLAQYRFDRYRPAKAAAPVLLVPEGVDAARLLAMAEGEFLTRDLVNTPASDMGPAELEAAFLALATKFGAKAEVITGNALDDGFPMIAAVGRASPRAPRLLDMRWGDAGPSLTLVGKGVCFDTGGLDIKPSSGMLQMKKDMGGAATVLGLAHMIMTLGVKVRLRVLVPAVENSIAGNAMRPRDILKSRKGLTVEVNNTDAEGRLVLGDALAYACEDAPDLLVSMATLTGAARVAVGPDLAPYYTDDAGIVAALEAGSVAGFDPVWRLPFHDAYEAIIEPGIADLDNAPGWGFAGSVTAALFLRRFVEGPRYLHFDIFAHTPADLPGRPKGAVGQGARAVFSGLPAMMGL